MSKHLIILVHGMGEFGDGWSQGVQGQLKALYSAYRIASDFPFEEYYRIEEITYNRRFDSLREQWRTDSAQVLASLEGGGLPRDAAAELAEASGRLGADHFLSTHLLDVALYRGVPMVAEDIRTTVARRILTTLLDNPDEDRPRWSMIAHSLGTAVAHDALHALFTHEVGGRTLAGATKAHVLMMVANVSRLLEEKSVDVYKSAVRPGALDGVCRYFINARHEWDPFPRPREFRPLDDWPDVRTRAERRYVPVTINAFQSKNIHALSHYLSNPKVHVEFFRRTFPMEGAIPDAELAQASMLYEASTPFGAFAALQEQLKTLQLAEDAPLQDVFRAFARFFEVLKSF